MSTSVSPPARQEPPSTASYLSFPVRYAVGGILRRLSTDPLEPKPKQPIRRPSELAVSSPISPYSPSSTAQANDPYSNQPPVSYTPPRSIPPFAPPPLTPLSLKGPEGSSRATHILSRTLAEEIRLLVPARLELIDTWELVFGLDLHGASLATLYNRCDRYRGKRGGFVIVVRDGANGVFGAYLNESPRPSHGHYYGNGECFLWRASLLSSIPLLSSLPPPPSADTTNLQRMTTLAAVSAWRGQSLSRQGSPTPSGTSTPDRIRFKAFPYSGLNDYMIFCEHGFLSVGGGDGHYGLWLDASLERGLSSPCPTFGNEALSDEGKKFDVIGLEVWFIGP